eukprot:GFYU01003899.1.p1 GENE.GFYU01003899.1~~GFYU01003899.1.p1  ORF type:complete len:204 (+),score=62.82 GFYU01003899.1:33-614(+)
MDSTLSKLLTLVTTLLGYTQDSTFPHGPGAIHLGINKNHCGDLIVSPNYDQSCFDAYWAAQSWQYTEYEDGQCDSKFNYVNKQKKICDGVLLTTRGIASPVSAEVDIQLTGADNGVPRGPYAIHGNVDGQHCSELVLDVDRKVDHACFDKYWGDHGYQFEHFSRGRCDKKFNYINHQYTICDGVTAYTRGMES